MKDIVCLTFDIYAEKSKCNKSYNELTITLSEENKENTPISPFIIISDEVDLKNRNSKPDSDIKKKKSWNSSRQMSFQNQNCRYYLKEYNFKSRTQLKSPIKLSKNMLGELIKSLMKDKVQLPIIFNEPISMLQKYCEKFQNCRYLKEANNTSNKTVQIALISAFIVSEMSLSINRVLKPFNPVRGETYEFCDNVLGYRYFSEQVSHHPPISAYHCESEDFINYGDNRCQNKFKLLKGALELSFTSHDNIILKSSGDRYTYNKPTLYLKGILNSKLHSDFSTKFCF